MSDHVVATLAASPPRRFMGTAMLGSLGGLLIYMAFSVPLGFSMVLFLVLGIGALMGTMRLFQATAQVLELTPKELRIQNGEVLAQVSEIQNVERGALAFKPSNGFLVTLKSNGKRRWAPGMFWAFSRKIGVGGVTSAPQTKGMAETLAVMIAERELKG